MTTRNIRTTAEAPTPNPTESIPVLDTHHVLIFSERGLSRILRSYFEYYERSRTHLGLAKDAPIPRPVQPPSLGTVIAVPQVGGLHHYYERRAA